jgi:hypothetical protein
MDIGGTRIDEPLGDKPAPGLGWTQFIAGKSASHRFVRRASMIEDGTRAGERT